MLAISVLTSLPKMMVLFMSHMTQSGLINRILFDLNLRFSKSSCDTPAPEILGPHKDSAPFDEDWNYHSILGKSMYLSSNTRGELAFANHQCDRFSQDPRVPHSVALKRIGRYLLGTRDKGMIIKPTKDLTLDCYADADYAGLFAPIPTIPSLSNLDLVLLSPLAKFLSLGPTNFRPRLLFLPWRPNTFASVRLFVSSFSFVSSSMK